MIHPSKIFDNAMLSSTWVLLEQRRAVGDSIEFTSCQAHCHKGLRQSGLGSSPYGSCQVSHGLAAVVSSCSSSISNAGQVAPPRPTGAAVSSSSSSKSEGKRPSQKRLSLTPALTLTLTLTLELLPPFTLDLLLRTRANSVFSRLLSQFTRIVSALPYRLCWQPGS